ncbi:hypothetical protein [Streptomyces sp. NPDC086519]|uniref:hypothetical protein n=1 Tax=Streptomyces sp. NPDC086519 TaxID=3154863 RepID=UPI00344916F9
MAHEVVARIEETASGLAAPAGGNESLGRLSDQTAGLLRLAHHADRPARTGLELPCAMQVLI